MSRPKPPLNVAIVGAGGRMGHMLIASVLRHDNARLAACFVRQHSPLIGSDVGMAIGAKPVGVPFSSLTNWQNPPSIDVVIDFSLPNALANTLEFCQKHGAALVLGVTGLDNAQKTALERASESIAIVHAGNYSSGVNTVLNLLTTAAKTLGLAADVEISESHHRHKIDAPSGTALMMAQAVADARGQNLPDVLNCSRHGAAQRAAGEIGIHALRGGDIIGEHRVQFILDGEMIEITHKASNRQIFADGALRAALWLQNQNPGLYNMQTVLGLSAN